MAMEWKDVYRAAKRGAGPKFRQLRRRDTDDWLASIGLERRNVVADLFGALGFVAIGAGVGFALGLVFAPKRGSELRRDIESRLRSEAERTGVIQQGTSGSPYAS